MVTLPPETVPPPLKMNGVVTLVELNAITAPFTIKVPAPLVVPADRSRVPLFTVHVCVDATVIDPVLVKLGDVPLWLSVTFPPVIAMVPLFVLTAPGRPIVRPCASAIVIVPWLLISARIERGPPNAASGAIDADGAFVRVPVVTARLEP